MTVQCIACGMPMEKDDEFATGDRSKNYCRYCARPDGSMQNYDEKLACMTGFLIRTQGLTEAVARKTARATMAALPAWAGKK